MSGTHDGHVRHGVGNDYLVGEDYTYMRDKQRDTDQGKEFNSPPQ